MDQNGSYSFECIFKSNLPTTPIYFGCMEEFMEKFVTFIVSSTIVWYAVINYKAKCDILI